MSTGPDIITNMSAFQLDLLVVDDDTLLLESFRQSLSAPWVFHGQTHERAPKLPALHAAFVDMHLSADPSRQEGLEAIAQLSKKFPQAEIVAMSGNLDRELMEKALKAGASRFLAKPLSPEDVQITLSKLEAYYQLLWSSHRNTTARWVGKSEASLKVNKQISQLRGEKETVLIEGESGTGKEVVAQLLHAQEGHRPFVVVNVAAIPENLFESELFGHMKGAFTGAQMNKTGLFEAAHGGDLFLDEIEALPLDMQAKLLRVLESGEVRRVGQNEATHVDVRVIAATNENLQKLVKKKQFREDLLWRLSSHHIYLPPLRDRKEDILELAPFFLSQKPRALSKNFDEDALVALQDHSWPGNVRELKRVCDQLALTSPLPMVRANDVKERLNPNLNSSPEAHFNFDSLDLDLGLQELMKSHEKAILQKALAATKEIDALAHTLKISRSSLYKKLKDYGLSV